MKNQIVSTKMLSGSVLAIAVSLASVSAFAKSPADVISLGMWSLQLPTGSPGSPDTISSSRLKAGFQNTYFKYDSSDNSVAFFAPANGVRTQNSAHPRSELREMASNGTSQANWDPFDSRTHTLSATLKVTDARNRLCVGQIHIGSVLRNARTSSTKPLMELYYESNGDLVIGVNRSPTDGQTSTKIGNVRVNTKFSYQISVSNRTLRVSINGATKYSKAIPSGFRDYGQYFKAGDYNQTSNYGSSSGTKNKFYALSVSHR